MIDALARRKNGGGEGGSPGRESRGESSSIESTESSQEIVRRRHDGVTPFSNNSKRAPA